jgi:hypothetical protein
MSEKRKDGKGKKAGGRRTVPVPLERVRCSVCTSSTLFYDRSEIEVPSETILF